MNAAPLHATHSTDFPPSKITVGGMHDHTLLAGPFSARIVDSCDHCACLPLTRVL